MAARDRECGVNDCARHQYAKGFCNLHWSRWHRTGTTDAVLRPGQRRLAKVDIPADLIGWLAGILEGEGSFITASGVTGGVRYQYPQIRLSMTDRDIVDRVGALFGVTTYPYKNQKRPGHKEIYSVILTGSRAQDVMQAVLPWMGDRRTHKINTLLQMRHGRMESAAA